MFVLSYMMSLECVRRENTGSGAEKVRLVKCYPDGAGFYLIVINDRSRG